jgi:outer membrane protein OmpA-like peptidoglycan-associated protein
MLAAVQVWGQRLLPGEPKAEFSSKVIDYFTRKPLHTRIVAELQPNENEVVIAKTDSSTGQFELRLRKKATYKIKVQHPGFLVYTTMLQTDSDSLLKAVAGKNIELIPVKKNVILPFEHLLFEVNNFQLSQHTLPELEKLASLLKANPNLVVRLEGHTDNVGKSKASMSLARKRIQSIEKFLASRQVPASQIRKKAFAGQNPISLGDSYDAHRLNRRVEVRIVKI